MSAAPRLAQLDALRGIAALAVVLFHYTTRYDRLFGHAHPPALALPDGHLGVPLFFVISGFVIYMTLEHTGRPMDFVVSRFSRLYPAYWGALALTFTLVHAMGLPGKTVGWQVLLVNLTMLQGFVGVTNVDGVYWTLEVELLFYAWALLCHRLGGSAGLRTFLFACLGLRVVYVAVAAFWGVDLPWMGQRWLLLPSIGWFALGVAAYRLSYTRGESRSGWAMAGTAIVVTGLAEGWEMAALALLFFVVVHGAAHRRWTWLERPVLLWLGAISYPLYLLHENIGWALLRQLEGRGMEVHLAIALTLAVSLVLAHALSRLVERPAMRWIRDRYRARRSPSVTAAVRG